MKPYSWVPKLLHLRRRSVWEAADSGILLWRKCFSYFIPLFAIPLYIAAFIIWVLCGGNLFLSCLILWWLKPFFDRFILHVVSRKFFGIEAFNIQGSEKSESLSLICKGLLRNLFSALAGDLLWRRFSPARGSRMPIRILEGTGKGQYRQRKKALVQGGLNFCYLITILGLCTEALLLVGEMIFGFFFLMFITPLLEYYLWANINLLVYAAFCLNYFLTESLYVCMGFGIYINSRVEVEGWDLELQFRKFSSLQKKKSIKMAVILFFLLFTIATPAALADQELSAEQFNYFPQDFPLPGMEEMEILDSVFSSDDFGRLEERWSIRSRYNEPLINTTYDTEPWMDNLQLFLGHFFRISSFIIIIGLASLVIFFAIKQGSSFPWFTKKKKRNSPFSAIPRKKGAEESAEFLFDIAEEYFKAGKKREAWTYCLAAYIEAYRQYFSLGLPAEETEYGCLEMLLKQLPEKAGNFDELLKNWIPFAYGNREPKEGSFEKLLISGRSLGTSP